jgi:PadR family transcriptional regulator, regulatory protein PadR
MDISETNEADKKFKKILNAGVAELILLGIVNRATGPMYGYQIARIIEESGPDIPIIKLWTLYPVLRSLEDSHLLASEVEPSVSGPPRRYYKITETGRQTLRRWTEFWEQMKGLVDNQLKADKDDK